MSDIERLQDEYSRLCREAAAISNASTELRRKLGERSNRRIARVIEAKYGEVGRDANKRVHDALVALNKAKELQAKTALTDERIYVEWKTSGRHWDRTTKPGRRGKLEVFTRESRVPGNMASYSRPSPGDVVMRVLKKDGAPSSFIERHGWKPESGWRTWYPEGEVPPK